LVGYCSQQACHHLLHVHSVVVQWSSSNAVSSLITWHQLVVCHMYEWVHIHWILTVSKSDLVA
jgi:hypothetical protein